MSRLSGSSERWQGQRARGEWVVSLVMLANSKRIIIQYPFSLLAYYTHTQNYSKQPRFPIALNGSEGDSLSNSRSSTAGKLGKCLKQRIT